MILHLIQKSPFTSNTLAECMTKTESDDAILLMHDGVYGIHHPEITQTSIKIFALSDDLNARGLKIESSHIQPISYDEFVELCTQYESSISW